MNKGPYVDKRTCNDPNVVSEASTALSCQADTYSFEGSATRKGRIGQLTVAEDTWRILITFVPDSTHDNGNANRASSKKRK